MLFAHAAVVQSRDESLGVSVAGGVKNQKGDTPIYISNITDMGCVGRTRQIQVSQPARPVRGISQSRRVSCVRKVIAYVLLMYSDNTCLFHASAHAHSTLASAQKGDVLLSINNHSLLDLSHTDAVKLLKKFASDDTVTLKVLESNETAPGLEHFQPSWKYWLCLPE